MDQTEGTRDIAAGPAEVMAVIAGFEAYPEWADVRSAKVLERDAEGRGSRVAFEVSAAGMTAAYTLSYRYLPGHAGVSWTTEEAQGAVKDVSGGYELEEQDGTTSVTYRLAVETSMPLPGFLRRQAEKKIVKTALDGLKRRVEEG
ncbi:MAG TPA: SRPBCC family protein [Actinomycetota bacterium]